MLIIPIYPDLRISVKPVVTVAIIVLCVVMHMVSDADWSHSIGNMIFFFAFGAALEILTGNTLLYLTIMISIMSVSALPYSMFTVVFKSAFSTLGFSDDVFVMGPESIGSGDLGMSVTP